MRFMLKSKIHRATVTQSQLHYVGSITIDEELAEAADLVANERVDVVNVNNGNRLTTYVLLGPRGSGIIGINGASARLMHPGDLLIIMGYTLLSREEAKAHQPAVVFVDERNRLVSLGTDAAEVPEGSGLVRGDVLAETDPTRPW